MGTIDQRRPARRRALLELGGVLLAVALAASIVPARARATDSEAPPGAGKRWLPCERWVMLHWLPYDEQRLFAMLRISREQAIEWIAHDQHHTFAQLFRRRGVAPKVAARRLVAPWTGGTSKERRSILRERALRTLTQGHLSQHVLFHYFHQPAIGAQARSIFNTSPMHYFLLRHAGYSPAEIGAFGGRSRTETGAGVARVWSASARRGARLGETPATQAATFVAHQLAVLQTYLDSAFTPKSADPPPSEPGWATPRPRIKLMCAIFAGRARAADAVNYGDELVGAVQGSSRSAVRAG